MLGTVALGDARMRMPEPGRAVHKHMCTSHVQRTADLQLTIDLHTQIQRAEQDYVTKTTEFS